MSATLGYAGKLLRVNLSTGVMSHETPQPSVLRTYLGGAGLGARLLWNEIPKGVRWSDPENRLMLLSGVLSGSKVKGSSTTSVVTQGAMTGRATSTQMNGFFAAFLKFAGFDAVIVQGKAPRLSYLYIHDGVAELRDAAYLAGKDSWETQDLIKQELGVSSGAMSVAAIGPAGEHLVRFAGVFCDYGHSASHNGPGAVMGSKNLKAIAVARGSGRVHFADDAKMSELANQLFDITKTDSVYSMLYKWGTLHLLEASAYAGRVPYRNYTTSVCPMTPEQVKAFGPEYLREHYDVIRPHPCWACQMHHCTLIRLQEGPLSGKEGEEPEFEGYTMMGPQIGIYDSTVATSLSNECDRLGFDVNEAGWTIGLAMECFEKGLLTADRTGGLELRFGNLEAIRELMSRIARREGVGNLLAEGAMRAAREIGGEAPSFAIHTMAGNSPLGHDHRPSWSFLFDISVANTGSYELHLSPRGKNVGLVDADPNSPEQVAHWVAAAKWCTLFFDSLGICRLPNREFPEILAALVNAATGWDYTVEEGRTMAFRTLSLLRAYNVRHGYSTAMDRPSPRYGSVPVDGPHKGRDIGPHWEKMLDIYYADLGWDRVTGKPLPETLHKLGLDDVVPEMWQS